MSLYVRVHGEKIPVELPKGWDLILEGEVTVPSEASDPREEVRRALQSPVGAPPLEKLAKGKTEVVVLFDDPQRLTPACIAFPEVLDALNRGGVSDERIWALCAVGTHSAPTPEQIRDKIGEEAFERLRGRVIVHDPYGDNVPIGRTHRGGLVEVNRLVVSADLVVGIGECMPHPMAGFGGGPKILMPGVCSFRSVAEHHFTWMRHPRSRVALLDGNPFYEEIADAARLAGLDFKVDFILDERGRVLGVFAGDPLTEHRTAAQKVADLFALRVPQVADVTITSAHPMEMGVQATKALVMASFCTRKGGAIIWILPASEARRLKGLLEEVTSGERADPLHRRLLEGNISEEERQKGVSHLMLSVFLKELFERFSVFVVAIGDWRGRSPSGVVLLSDMEEAIKRSEAIFPQAKVLLFPSGGSVLPLLAR